MKKATFYIDEVIKFYDGKEQKIRGFNIAINGNMATLAVPSDIYGDPDNLYKETIDTNETEVFQATYENGTPVHFEDGEGLGELTFGLNYWKFGGKMGVDTPVFVYADNILLPQGFAVVENARVGVVIQTTFDMVEPEVIIECDPRWSNGREAHGFDYGQAVKYVGGEEKIKQMIRDLLDEWKEATK